MTEVRDRRSAVRNQRAEINRRDAERAELFLCALCASVVKSISDLRVLISGLCALLLAFSLPAQAQSKIPHVGILFMGGRDQPHLEAFKQGLREHGYDEGKNLILEYRYAEGKYDRLPELAKEFVREKVDVIVTTSTISAQAARKATRTIPIVMTSGSPVERGLAESLAKPGGNVTGLSALLPELSGKRVELLKEAFPKITRLATLWSPRSSEAVIGLKETETAAHALAIQLHPVKVQAREDIENAFAALPKANVNALLVVLSPEVTLHSKIIVELALKQRLAGMYPTRQFAEEGGLMAYGPLIGDLYRRAAAYVDKILKGAKPEDLPVEQPTKFEFVVNLKAAKQIGVTFPQSVLFQADKVIR
jgi:putative tryptophan/tyrosine transport system substrate-binding protein